MAGDVPGLVALVDAVAAEGRWLLISPGHRTAVEEHLLLAQLAAMGGLSLSLEVSDTVSGRVVVARETDPGGRSVGELAILLGAAVRGRGMGRSLLTRAVAWAVGAGLDALYLRVRPDNAPAVALYRSLGFADAERSTHTVPGTDPERGVELLRMTLELGGLRARPLLSSPPDE
ncbi:MAG: N-acetyltransferase family protein [Candidatus Dormibacteria bacterium]